MLRRFFLVKAGFFSLLRRVFFLLRRDFCMGGILLRRESLVQGSGSSTKSKDIDRDGVTVKSVDSL